VITSFWQYHGSFETGRFGSLELNQVIVGDGEVRYMDHLRRGDLNLGKTMNERRCDWSMRGPED
jgi:hypothetical protein